MKRFLPVILLALSLVVVAGCGNQGGNPDALLEKAISDRPITVMTIRDGMVERFSLTMRVTVRAQDAGAFDKEYESFSRQINESIAIIMRDATPEERMEVEFTTIKERAKERINEILGTPWVQEVIITGVTFEVQEP